MASAEQQVNPISLRERKKQQTRQDLLAVAQKLFDEFEFDDVTVDQIVEVANVSPKTFFNYFQNKSQFLSEYMFDWLKTFGFWSFEDSPIVDCRSSIIPSDAHDTINWIVEHRRMFKMAMHHTDFLDFIYRLDEDSAYFDEELHATIRKPRLARVKEGQSSGMVRNDISAAEICRMYDALRVDLVRRWLCLRDEDASQQRLHDRYEELVAALIRGIEPRD